MNRRSPWTGVLLYLLVPGTFFLLGCLAAWFFLAGERNGDAKASLPPADQATEAKDEPTAPTVFRDNTREVSQGAATLAGAGSAGGHAVFMELALLRGGEGQHLWKIEETGTALPLDAKLLARVVDGEPVGMLPSFRAKGKKGQVPDLDDLNDLEALAFCDALIKANLTSQGAFANSTRRDLTFADLYNTPKKHRGEVIHQEGALRRVRRSDPPPNARAKGVDHLYEGWVFDTRYGTNPVCLVFTELPAGLTVAEQMNRQISFDAYFFKKYRYQSADSKPGYVREAPLFIGRGPVLAKAETASGVDTSWSTPLLIGFLGVLLATVVLAFGLHGWFRRGDRHVQKRLAGVRHREFVEPNGPTFPDTTPSAN